MGDDEEPALAQQEEPTLSVDVGKDSSKATFTLTHEDHTLGNAVRYILAKKWEPFGPEVNFVGYSVPHPSEPKMNVRVQTTGASSAAVFKEALLTLYKVADQIDDEFKQAIDRYRKAR